ncbi:MAG: 30S ribosomal protein S16 [Nannocystaceae bacterium]|nr:30S ribosomal protein S16 [Nannocystaceae bacterium]
MAVKIRLARVGAKKRPFYRVVATDVRSPRDGRFLEKLGTINPNTEVATVDLNMPRIEYWLSHGALPTQTMARIIRSEKKKAAGAAT